ncbi:Protein phosphatase 2C 3 [Abeliophyllum distichum]|uniref:Protein phosphatase 2C 3 n=1 Tax=Abeliophyllum distichum TaxID=126358 RepID=A0ABD1URN2_9LAMI
MEKCFKSMDKEVLEVHGGAAAEEGDHYLRPFVISEPEVTVQKRTESDDFLIIATDGLWDVVHNEFACEVVRKCLGRNRSRFSNRSGASEATVTLVEVAIAKGSKDDISIIVVQLW